MLSSLWLLALTLVLLIVASAFFSSAETALTAVSDARMRQLANQGNKRAKVVEKLRADREGLIGSILIGNNAVNVLGSALATSFAIALFGEGGLVLATIGMTVLCVLVCPYEIANSRLPFISIGVASIPRILGYIVMGHA